MLTTDWATLLPSLLPRSSSALVIIGAMDSIPAVRLGGTEGLVNLDISGLGPEHSQELKRNSSISADKRRFHNPDVDDLVHFYSLKLCGYSSQEARTRDKILEESPFVGVDRFHQSRLPWPQIRLHSPAWKGRSGVGQHLVLLRNSSPHSSPSSSIHQE